MKFIIEEEKNYTIWYEKQTAFIKAQINKRLMTIQVHGHFGKIRHIDAKLWELKFKSGLRIYFYRSGIQKITLVLGGNKNGQKKDIQKAKKLYN